MLNNFFGFKKFIKIVCFLLITQISIDIFNRSYKIEYLKGRSQISSIVSGTSLTIIAIGGGAIGLGVSSFIPLPGAPILGTQIGMDLGKGFGYEFYQFGRAYVLCVRGDDYSCNRGFYWENFLEPVEKTLCNIRYSFTPEKVDTTYKC